MIIYKSTKDIFLRDAIRNNIANRVESEFEKRIGKVNKHEFQAWENSLRYMAQVISIDEIPDDATVCIEYKIPNQQSRIDFIIAGQNEKHEDNVVIIELKQWTQAIAVKDKDLVSTILNGGFKEVVHPSYQAWSYAVTLKEYNETVQEENILLFPCAYMHNYVALGDDDIVNKEIFKEINYAPVFTNSDSVKLSNFIAQHICYGDSSSVMERIDSGRIRPSKSLQDVLGSLLRGNKEFVLMDEQKSIFENIMHSVRHLDRASKKKVFIVEGGPGTGKSVLAINLLAKSLLDGKNAAYVTKNSAPRDVYAAKLANDKFKKAYIRECFVSSGKFVESSTNDYDVLLVDEAHRLNAKSGLFYNLGENQIKEIINASIISVFFIDESQIVTAKDIGSIKEIVMHAKNVDAQIIRMQLQSQFRCNGSDGYLNFLDDILGIKQTYYTFDSSDYDIQVCDDLNSMMEKIRALNEVDNKSRMLSGYCWEWASKKNQRDFDITIPEQNFKAQWNFNSTKTWAIDPNSVDQIGCIHTSQGLEFNYVGVIIGDDLRYENGRVITDYTKRAKTDKSLDGLKGECKKNDIRALSRVDKIIRDTYKTLLSRGMKGCFVYCTDKALSDYIKQKIQKNNDMFNAFNKDLAVAESIS